MSSGVKKIVGVSIKMRIARICNFILIMIMIMIMIKLIRIRMMSIKMIIISRFTLMIIIAL